MCQFFIRIKYRNTMNITGYAIEERKSFSVGSGTKAESLAKNMAEKLSPEFINDLYSELGKLIQEHHNEHNWIP